MKNIQLTQLDTDQIHKATFEEAHDAQRVILIGGELKIDPSTFTDAVKEGFKNLNIEFPKNPELEIREKPVFIPKIERIEIPVIVKEIEYREIEKHIIVEKIVTIETPTIIKQIEYREIEKPIIVKEIQTVEIIKERYYPFIIKLTAVLQTVAVLGLLLINLLKK